jgi:hypothetical protein
VNSEGRESADRDVRVSTTLSLYLSLVLSFVATIVSVGTLWITWAPRGEVHPIAPSGYAVMRGIPKFEGLGPFPSDHLVLPLEWATGSRGREALR